MSIVLDSTDVVSGLAVELERFRDLAVTVTDEQARAVTRWRNCTVHDVLGHVTGAFSDIAKGRVEDLASFATAQRQMSERRDATVAELVSELEVATHAVRKLLPTVPTAAWREPAPAGFDGTLLDAVTAVWEDTVVHADDIRAALGRPPDVDSRALGACVSHVVNELRKARRGVLRLEFDGLPTVTIDGPMAERHVATDPVRFVLAAVGRIPPHEVGLLPDDCVEN